MGAMRLARDCCFWCMAVAVPAAAPPHSTSIAVSPGHELVLILTQKHSNYMSRGILYMHCGSLQSHHDSTLPNQALGWQGT
jgi:hypothetical protein